MLTCAQQSDAFIAPRGPFPSEKLPLSYVNPCSACTHVVEKGTRANDFGRGTTPESIECGSREHTVAPKTPLVRDPDIAARIATVRNIRNSGLYGGEINYSKDMGIKFCDF